MKLKKIAAAEPPAPKFVAPAPPEPVAPLVGSRLRVVQRELAELKAQIPERAVASAAGKPGGREALAELHQKISAAEFEIGCSAAAREFAILIDQAAAASWSAEVQALEPADIVAGITRDQCARRCRAGLGCVISAADPLAGPCCHPVLVGRLELTRYQENPKVAAVYAAACALLDIRRAS